MIIEKGQIFNLMDTNGRRSDVLNALKVYLEVLEELKKEHPNEKWANYPSSIAQFLFYEKALEKSKDVFKKHGKYDTFIENLGNDYQLFIEKDSKWIDDNFGDYRTTIDTDMEKRARHYTSNLVKIGFTSSDRCISEAGNSYLKGSVHRDRIEELLPLNSINIILIRQLAKLRIVCESSDGKLYYYSPFFMALSLLLGEESIDKSTFEIVVQGLSPFTDNTIKERIRDDSISVDMLEESIRNIEVKLPEELKDITDIELPVFKDIFKSSKSSDSISRKYFKFYCALRDFRNNKTVIEYNNLIACFDGNDASIINKAFGYGKSVFACGNRGSRYSIDRFMRENKNHPFLTSDDFIYAFYSAFYKSKWIDGIREYSDTTIRLLSATGLFKFKNLPELAYKEVLSLMFDSNIIRNSIFGEMSYEEYNEYEKSDNCYYCRNISLLDILNYSTNDVSEITERLENKLGVSAASDVKKVLNDRKNADFISHIKNKYPKEKIIELLPLFSDRSKDAQIKNEVNDSATVPTIYEYIIGIAWYYLSSENINLYNSLNLTLNADFDPVIHAGGGNGDIIINYENIVVMLEVTLMNKQAQKRGEWEPVLRHSLNLKADYEPKDSITFFIADELDYNTINIWRAVAAVSLESTNTHEKVDGVTIMPFTNASIVSFLEREIDQAQIISAVKASFSRVPKIEDAGWHEEIIKSINI